ncbi:carbamoyltransferase [Nocardiopsis alba]|uniref:carbamoyltransferase family protein n=1 Tax=Nocardiopsis alba TaxID=53437 RepID=UPI00340D6FE5
MKILGYNGFSSIAELYGRLYGFTPESVDRHSFLGHDAGAALFIDGELVAAVEEERMNRWKKTTAFPINAMNWCLEQAGLTYDDIDLYAFGWKFTEEFADSAITRIAGAPIPAEYRLQALGSFGELYNNAFSRTALLRDFTEHTGHTLPDEKLICVPHHEAHLACGLTFAGTDDTAFYISDGQSEMESVTVGEVRNGEVNIFPSLTISAADSLAMLFAEVTRYLGFVPNNDEYKVMGLAGFGTPPELNPFLEKGIVTLTDDGRYTMALANDPRGPRAYQPLFDDAFDGTEDDRHRFDFRVKVATAAQQLIELATSHHLHALARETDLRDLIFEGGLALNCVNNTKLLRDSPFERIEVSFGASDPGVSIGAAAHTAMARSESLSAPSAPYLGPEYETEEIRAVLDAHASELTWEHLPGDAIVERTAELLTGRTVIGWFQGRTEYGPRALGNRSILANPSFPEMKDIINTRVKHREEFRPFAPIVLEEDAHKVFDLSTKSKSPYMTFVFPVRPEYRERIAAATHVDHTSRIQTVGDEDNPLLASLLRAFIARTDVPCLVNTSFNVAGEPIVCSPADAVSCFLGTDIDHVVIGEFLVTKA